MEIKHLDKNINIHLYENEVVSDIIKNSKTFFELNFLEYIRKNYNIQNNIVDIGANIGNHSLYFSEYLTYNKIICFEPFLDNYELLSKNMVDKNCELYNIALNDKEEEIPLYNSQKNNNGGFSLHNYNGISYIVKDKIKTTTLDCYNFNDVSMIKIDVEGHETHVLNGAKNTILRCNPIIFIENLAYDYPHLFNINQYDEFFNSVGYKNIDKNIAGSYMDLWIKK